MSFFQFIITSLIDHITIRWLGELSQRSKMRDIDSAVFEIKLLTHNKQAYQVVEKISITLGNDVRIRQLLLYL